MSRVGNPPSKISAEIAVAVHIVLLVTGITWAFGGNADWVRVPIAIWGSLGILFTAAHVVSGSFKTNPNATALRWIWPVLALNLLVLASCLTSGFVLLKFGSAWVRAPKHIPWWQPSSADWPTSISALWLFDAIYFSCFNLTLVVQRRRTIRWILGACVCNAVALSIFGTAQKLSGATGIYFNAVETPQPLFFASFVYDNHWGAYIILMMAACAGLTLRALSSNKWGGLTTGPGLAGLAAAVIMALTVPFSGARACTTLLAVLLAVAVVQGAPRIAHALRLAGASPLGAHLAIAIAAIFAGLGAWMVAGDVIEARALKTKEQVADLWSSGGIGIRSVLYRDTLRMASDRKMFGWGMGTYPLIFDLYNTQVAKDHNPVIYHDAHSDWLQSLAELGIVGSILIASAVLVPLAAVRRLTVSPLPRFLLLGCALVAVYAWIEFPFGNVAVVASWWLFFFSAIHYTRITDWRPIAPVQ